MKDYEITLEGTIYFDPDDVTKKHKDQASWKKMAMVIFNGDVSEYYGWFIKKRFNLELNKPLRGAHISFINDNFSDMSKHTKTHKERVELWEGVKKKYHKKKIQITLDVRPHFSTQSHWWLIVPHDKRDGLQAIRDELGFVNPKTGLSKPYFGMHMTIGHANEKNVEHSTYIINLINKGFIKFD